MKVLKAIVGIITPVLTALGLDLYLASQGVVDLGLALKGTKKR